MIFCEQHFPCFKLPSENSDMLIPSVCWVQRDRRTLPSDILQIWESQVVTLYSLYSVGAVN
jgi:hypothetical protein